MRVPLINIGLRDAMPQRELFCSCQKANLFTNPPERQFTQCCARGAFPSSTTNDMQTSAPADVRRPGTRLSHACTCRPCCLDYRHDVDTSELFRARSDKRWFSSARNTNR